MAYQDVNIASDSELPLVLKTYFYLSNTSEVTEASTTLDVTYTDGTSDLAVAALEFGASPGGTIPGTWTPSVDAVYPTKVVVSATVRIGHVLVCVCVFFRKEAVYTRGMWRRYHLDLYDPSVISRQGCSIF